MLRLNNISNKKNEARTGIIPKWNLLFATFTIRMHICETVFYSSKFIGFWRHVDSHRIHRTFGCNYCFIISSIKCLSPSVCFSLYILFPIDPNITIFFSFFFALLYYHFCKYKNYYINLFRANILYWPQLRECIQIRNEDSCRFINTIIVMVIQNHNKVN